jgi:protein-S-isoprenylcysteine O-methyltransferase Ste14
MLTSVFLNILAISLFFKSVFVLIYFVGFATMTTRKLVFVEEIELLKTFGKEYEIYKENVPRFIPRLTKFEISKNL